MQPAASDAFHERLDASELLQLVPVASIVDDDGLTVPWPGNAVTGPRDLCRVLNRRLELERFHSRGEPVPTDLCLWSPGAPEHPACTKVGGFPYLGADREWPRDRNGQPMVFHWQFNFADSRDIVPQTPGDVLLVFRAANAPVMADSQRGDIALVWQDILPVGAPLLFPATESPFTPYYAALVREHDYPDQLDSLWSVFDDELSEEDEAHLGDVAIACSNLAVFKASKIGGVYDAIQRSHGDPDPGAYLAQLNGIEWIELDHQFVHGTPSPSYPDHETRRAALQERGVPIDPDRAGRSNPLGDLGLIGVYTAEDGRTVIVSESH